MPRERPNMHTAATATRALQAAGFDVIATREIEHGTQLRVDDANVVNVYSTGKTLPQGPLAATLRECLRMVPDESIIPADQMPADPHAESYRTTSAMIGRMLAAMPRDATHAPFANPAWNPAGTGAPF